MSVPDQIGSTSSACSSPLVRTKFTGLDTSIEYSTQPVEEIEQNEDSRTWEDRPSTPTILGYEVMEERAKFTVSFGHGRVGPVMTREQLTVLCIIFQELILQFRDVTSLASKYFLTGKYHSCFTGGKIGIRKQSFL